MGRKKIFMKRFLRILVILLCFGIIVGAFILYEGHKLYKEALDQISLEDKVAQEQKDEVMYI